MDDLDLTFDFGHFVDDIVEQEDNAKKKAKARLEEDDTNRNAL